METITRKQWQQAQKDGTAHIRADGQTTILKLDEKAGTVLQVVKVVR